MLPRPRLRLRRRCVSLSVPRKTISPSKRGVPMFGNEGSDRALSSLCEQYSMVLFLFITGVIDGTAVSMTNATLTGVVHSLGLQEPWILSMRPSGFPEKVQKRIDTMCNEKLVMYVSAIADVLTWYQYRVSGYDIGWCCEVNEEFAKANDTILGRVSDRMNAANMKKDDRSGTIVTPENIALASAAIDGRVMVWDSETRAMFVTFAREILPILFGGEQPGGITSPFQIRSREVIRASSAFRNSEESLGEWKDSPATFSFGGVEVGMFGGGKR